jgi:DNA primase
VPGIPEETIAEVRERTDIVQVIGQHVQLRKSGGNHIGLCPFHDEKTPSFNVNSQRQFFHCFGCHESGDVFRFLMKLEGRKFNEVVEDLAGRAGVEIPRQNLAPEQVRAAAARRSEKQAGLDLNRKVAELYRALLLGERGEPGRRYLEGRGIGAAISEGFRLGYAPPSGNAVVSSFEKERISLELGERLGLVAKRRTGEGYHDRFWNRLMFPIIGPGGEVLAFGGRLLGDGDGPKYINTPETALYHKGEALFGLEAAAKAIRSAGEAILVEGNFDVLSMHQAGFANTVAPMGTALTERQVRLLLRFAPRVVALFDGDDAGRAASQRAVRMLVEAGVEARIASLPAKDDPDSLLRGEGGQAAMAAVLASGLPAIDYLVARLSEGMEDTIPARVRVLEQVAPVVALLESRVARELYAVSLSQTLGVDQATVMRAIHGERPRLPEAAAAGRPADQKPAAPPPKAELDILEILVKHPHLVPRAERAGAGALIATEGLRHAFLKAVDMQLESGHIDSSELLPSIPFEVRDAVAQALLSEAYVQQGDPTKALDDCLRSLERRRLKREIEETRTRLKKAQSENDTESSRELLVEIVELERRVHGGARDS